MKESETKDLLLENLQLVKEQSIQLNEGIVRNHIMIYVINDIIFNISAQAQGNLLWLLGLSILSQNTYITYV